MPRLPDAFDLGQRPTPQLVRRVAQVPGGNAGIEGLGEGLVRLADRQQQTEDTFNLAKAQSLVLNGSIVAEGEAQEGQDWRGWGKAYNERMKGVLSEASQLISDPQQRELFMMDGETSILRGNERIKGQQKTREVDEGRASLDSIINGNMDSAMGVEDEATRSKLLGNINAAISGARDKGYISAEAAGTMQRNSALTYARRRLDMMTPEQQLEAVGGGDMRDPASLIRRFEGFRNSPYWDVNAHRVGFGSDTYTLPDGTVRPVRPDSFVTWEDANRDLSRRIGETQAQARDKVGLAFDAMSPEAKAAITSVAYNYGEVPDRLVSAIRSGDNDRIADAVEGLSGDNEGVNAGRRKAEADAIRGAAPSMGEFLPLDERLKIAHGALRAMEAERAAAEKEYASGFSDYVGAISAGAEVPDFLATKYSDEAIQRTVSSQADQQLMMATRDQAQMTAGYASAIEGSTPDEMQAIVAGSAAPAVAGSVTDMAMAPQRAQDQAALAKAVENDLKAREADPAAYVLQYRSPAAEAATGIGKGGEEAYAQAALAEQARIGIQRPMLLPGPMAKQTVASIMETPPDTRGAIVAQVADQWGKSWPKVLTELKAAGLDPVIYHAALVADDPVLSEQIASLATTPAKELEEGLPSTELNDLKADLESDISSFRAAFEAGDPTGAAAQTMNDLNDVAYGLALQQYRKTGNAGEAVAYATDRLINDRYHILDAGQFQGYAPAEYDPRQIEEMGAAMLEPEALAAVIPPADTAAPEFLRNEQIRQAAANGTWITNATGDGMVLVADFDGRPTQIMTAAGPYGFKFENTRAVAPPVGPYGGAVAPERLIPRWLDPMGLSQ